MRSALRLLGVDDFLYLTIDRAGRTAGNEGRAAGT
jgi:hypothetical protein